MGRGARSTANGGASTRRPRLRRRASSADSAARCRAGEPRAAARAPRRRLAQERAARVGRGQPRLAAQRRRLQPRPAARAVARMEARPARAVADRASCVVGGVLAWAGGCSPGSPARRKREERALRAVGRRLPAPRARRIAARCARRSARIRRAAPRRAGRSSRSRSRDRRVVRAAALRHPSGAPANARRWSRRSSARSTVLPGARFASARRNSPCCDSRAHAHAGGRNLSGSIGLPSRRISKCSLTCRRRCCPSPRSSGRASPAGLPSRGFRGCARRRTGGLVVLDDDELAVAAQPAAGVDDAARRAREHRLAAACPRCRCLSGSPSRRMPATTLPFAGHAQSTRSSSSAVAGAACAGVAGASAAPSALGTRLEFGATRRRQAPSAAVARRRDGGRRQRQVAHAPDRNTAP